MRALSIHDEPGLPPRHNQGDGGGLHVQPRIQELERRMLLQQQQQQQQQQQLRNTPEQPQRRCGNTSHTPSNAQYYSDSEEEEDIHIHSTPTAMMTTTTTATPNFEHRNKENTNHTPATTTTTTTTTALVLHSPILASIYNSNIKQFEADVLKRQAEYTNRISDLEGRLALFHSRLAMECAERGREQASTVEEYIDGPLEHAMRRSLERITTDFVVPILDPRYARNLHDNSLQRDQPSSAEAIDSEGNNNSIGKTQDEPLDANEATVDTTPAADTTITAPTTLPNLVSVERRTNQLEDQMNHYKHIVLAQARRQSFDNIDKTCRQHLQPALVLEMTKSNKREVGVVRRFESNAGENVRLVAEMTASRVSSLGYITNEVDDWETIDSTFAEHYLEEIQLMKQRVIEMREERLRQDEMVVKRILQDKTVLEAGLFSVYS